MKSCISLEHTYQNPRRQPIGKTAAWSWLFFCAIAWSAPVLAQSDCQADSTARLFANSTVNLRIDNDMFGGRGQDQGYSNGFLISTVSPNLVDYREDPCLPDVVAQLNRYLAWLQPTGFDEQNMTMGVGQLLFTPNDRKRTDLITDDRPYAAALLFSAGYNARSGDALRTSQIRLGMVGPSALGRPVQNGWHSLIGVEHFEGWGNQLHDEPVLQLIHERRQRWLDVQNPDGWGWDAIRHWGGSLGNFATYANTGAEWRFGYHLPNDFGTAPLRPAGENTSPGPKAVAPGEMTWHMFITIDARWVIHDITLDGNTFESSHSVEKLPFVADLGYGMAFSHGLWKFAFARYFRTQEFKGQKETPVYGSFTVSRRF